MMTNYQNKGIGYGQIRQDWAKVAKQLGKEIRKDQTVQAARRPNPPASK